MSGTYKPIAALSPDNQGPANTIVAIVLCATSVLFSSVRYAIGRKKLLQFDSDDATFGAALCFGITMSVVSNVSVTAGLGQHQDALSPEKVERYFKLHWATQFLAVIALACAKMSIVLMFRRIVPVPFAPLTLKILVPVTTMYAVICMLLIGFQCQLPSPWILDPKSCSTHGHIYYATIALNILTDLLLAGWMLPAIWALQMERSTKVLVMSLFASRVVVCIVDVGRLILLKRALDSDDQTCVLYLPPLSCQLTYAGTHLLWAIFDQVAVHLSINHATLPRVHVFLGNLQTGLLVTRITTSAVNTGSKGSKPSRDADETLVLSGTDDKERSSRWKWRFTTSGSRSTSRMMKLILKSDRSDTNEEASLSESPLRLQPEQGIELSTTIYADGDSTASAKGRDDSRYELNRQTISTRGSITALPNEYMSRHSNITINVHKTVEMKTELSSGTRRLV
ncbi:hypothetical protein CC78DRAFT_549644 [Lojkania enalia]|uniref:Rhodopsin domain-containing protein n=1 Tax=Lojkania enalia TaxID=147567 RepID=A0A9P4JVN9_9PLEO|nr:hypothetical protein CC78DRAFT_549644 [Didymosphaeria enalia]